MSGIFKISELAVNEHTMLLLAHSGPWKYLWRAGHFTTGPKVLAGGFGCLSPDPLGTCVTLSPQACCD